MGADSGRVLISDLDGTLLGDDAGLEEFAAWHGHHQTEWRLVYSSGRLADSVFNSIATTALPQPDAVIAGVGTFIRVCSHDGPLPDWPPPEPSWCAQRVRQALTDHTQLTLQPEEFQSRHKVSWFLPDADQHQLDSIRSTLRTCCLDVQLVYSSQRDLDILPAGIHKGSAALRLMELWGIPADRVVVSGDSGNDLSMFRPEWRGIVVANAQAELKTLRAPSIYHAQRPMASGVTEGLLWWDAQIG